MDQRTIPSTPLATLTKALATVSRARSRDEVVATIRSTARALIGCQGIAVVEEDAIGPLWKGHRFPMSACVSGWAMIARETAVIPDVSVDERVPKELYATTFVRAMAMAPVNVEEPVAAIGAYWSQPYMPATWEVETLEALAEAAATAMKNIEVVEALSAPKEFIAPDLPNEKTSSEFAADIARVAGIAAVPTILDVVLRMTGMGFAAVARVTDTRWVACQVLDPVRFGLSPGDELPLDSTLCNEIRGHRQTIVFDDAAEDPQYCDHHTPRIYGLRSYISEPIILSNGAFWGTLCAIDPNPAKVKNPEVLGAFKLFAELIAHHLDAETRLVKTSEILDEEREMAELREQFIAVLGHDLRNPIAAIDAGTSRLLKEGWTDRSPLILNLMKSSILRMSGLVENVMDLARARMGGGIVLAAADGDLSLTLGHVVDELKVANPERKISSLFELPANITLDHLRIAQMISNLLSNSVTHGDPELDIKIAGHAREGVLEISVSNGGEPIPPDRIGNLFMPFRRGEAKSGVQGLGLGLYIASQIASAHGGQLGVRSDQHETRFTFTMPMEMI